MMILKGNWYAGDRSKECVHEGKYLNVNDKQFTWIKYTRQKFSATKLPVSKTMVQLHEINYATSMNIQKKILICQTS